MTFHIQLAASAVRQLDALPEKAAAAVLEALQRLTVEPERQGAALGNELAGLLSMRRGPYRVVYRIRGDQVEVVRVGHRSQVYRSR